MILLDDKQVEALEARRLAEEQLQQEPPPAYASLHASSATTLVPPAKPTNFVSITKVHANIKEAITIDPSLYIPNFLLPPLALGEEEQDRKNVRLEATHGYVYGKMKLLPYAETEPPQRRRRVRLELITVHGGVSAKIVETASRPAFHLRIYCTNGNVQVHLPRSFHGPITLCVRHGSAKFSDDLSMKLTTFGEVNGKRSCFIGDFSSRVNGREGWQGDEVVVEVKNGGVKLQYEDDVVGTAIRPQPGFLNKVFGF
ncbi:hypothetical protein BDQ12DRAFT_678516 [Crucibulum laeve]|uniref:DUF7330 domain-containing protein n=1 Tax=Crucibulum laeve TaxID=68775 RepID=A0A5C3MA81_9AGAR|nr:hypothetical protein BDQ12DRAFT_678516 [Crucibulum laeve]